MIREYELTMITNAQMSEADSKQLFDKYEGIILGDGGQIIRKNDWGTKKIAFPINKQFRGRYVHYDLTSKPENLKQAEKLMLIDDNVLRFLSIRLGENVDPDARKAELAKIDAKAAAQKEANNNAKEKSRY